MARILYGLLGFISAGCAILGAVLPVMPTTIFVIIALWAFSKSSNRLYSWLSKLPILRNAMKHVTIYNQKKAVSANVKIIAQAFSWSSAVIILLSGTPLFVKILVVLSALSCSYTMFKLKTLR